MKANDKLVWLYDELELANQKDLEQTNKHLRYAIGILIRMLRIDAIDNL